MKSSASSDANSRVNAMVQLAGRHAAEHRGRVGRERERDERQIEDVGAGAGVAQDRAVPHVHAVVVADRDDTALLYHVAGQGGDAGIEDVVSRTVHGMRSDGRVDR